MPDPTDIALRNLGRIPIRRIRVLTQTLGVAELPNGSGTISGIATINLLPGAGAICSLLTDPGNQIVRQTVAAGDGSYSFNNLPPGRYQVLVYDPAQGYRSKVLHTIVGTPAGIFRGYWRVNFSAAQSGGYVSIAELEFRATPGGANQAVGGVPFASSSYSISYGPENAFDGNIGSEWASANGFPHNVGYDFAAPVTVGEIAIRATDAAYGGANEMPRDFTIEYSADGSIWTSARTVTGETGWVASEVRLYSVSV